MSQPTGGDRADMNPAEIANIARTEESLWWYRGMRRILRSFLGNQPLAPRSLVLEAGCGTGYNSRVLEQDYGWRLAPLDLDWGGLQHARGMGLQRLCQGDLAALPFADASFAAVVSLDVIVHFPPGRETEAFAELARVLEPGGLLVVRVSALDILRSRHSMHASERQRFTAGRLKRQIAETGLRVRRTTYANALLMPIALFKFRIWEPLTGAEPQSGVLPVPGWLDSLLYAPLAMEAALIGAGVNFPAGQSLLIVAEKPRDVRPGS